VPAVCSNYEESLRETESGLTTLAIFQVGSGPGQADAAGKGKKRFLVMAVDYFSKWTEAAALATVTADNVINFLWRSVVYRFGIPYAFVTDNGAQFAGGPFRKWCAELCIRNHYSTPTYPQSNGQVEATNKTLMGTLKKKLDRRKGLWVECVSKVLWSY